VRVGAASRAFDLRGVAADEVASLDGLTVRALGVSTRGALLRYEVAWPPGSEPLLLRAGSSGFEASQRPR
jgi:hypothetical protein